MAQLRVMTINVQNGAADPARLGALNRGLRELAPDMVALQEVVVSLHWGPNWGSTPPADHRSLAAALIEAGADIIWGHSPHVFRGIGLKRGRPIIYGAGDFVDDYAVDERRRNDQSLAFLVETDGRRVARLRLRPTVIRGMQARLAWGAEARQILDRVSDLSRAEDTPIEVHGAEAVVAVESA